MRRSRDSSGRVAPVEIVLAWLGIVAAAPYAALKVVWIFGGTIGMADPTVFDEPTYLVANVITLGMELLLTLLLVSVVHPTGLRLQGWLILLPSWGAVGLLIPVAGTFLLTAGGSFAGTVTGDGLQPWVYAMVYSGFTVQAIVLAILVCRYARRRWSIRFAGPLAISLGTVLTGAVLAAFLVAVAIVQSLWAAEVTAGLTAAVDRGAQAAFREGSVVDAAASLCAAVGGGWVIASAQRPSASGRWWPIGLAFFGTAACTMWGAYQFVTATAFGPVDVLFDAVAVTRAVCGGLLALLVFVLVRRALRSTTPSIPEAVGRARLAEEAR